MQALLNRWWRKAIHEGLLRIETPRLSLPFELVYWADIMHERPLKPWLFDEEHPLYLEEPYRRGTLERPKKTTGWRVTVYKYLEQQLDKIFLNKDMSLNYSGVSDRIVRRYFKDLDIYFSETPCRIDPARSARSCLHERLLSVLERHRKKEILLIGHSMGSIIAYDVLMQAPDNIEIHTFVTIGSPLGLPVVVGKIFAHQPQKDKSDGKLKTPENITHHWYNISDVEDRVALDHTLADDYLPNSKGIRAVDIEVFNDYQNNGNRNSHKSYGYLRTPECAGIIDAFLGKERQSYFQMALIQIKNYISRISISIASIIYKVRNWYASR